MASFAKKNTKIITGASGFSSLYTVVSELTSGRCAAADTYTPDKSGTPDSFVGGKRGDDVGCLF